MQGALCHDSGQSVHSVLKSMNGLNKETLLDIDGRIVHTLMKFCCIGWCYFWLLHPALMVAGALEMAY
jgi:hypothetical protein